MGTREECRVRWGLMFHYSIYTVAIFVQRLLANFNYLLFHLPGMVQRVCS